MRHTVRLAAIGAAVVVTAAAVVSHSTGAVPAYDLAVSLASWSKVSDGEADVSISWLVQNRGQQPTPGTYLLLGFGSGGPSLALPPGPPEAKGCSAMYIGEVYCFVPELGAGATTLITSRLRLTDRSSFGVAAFIAPPGGPSATDANPVDNDAVLSVGGGEPGPRPAFGPTTGTPLVAVASAVTFTTLPGRCRAFPKPEQLWRMWRLAANRFEVTIVGADGSTALRWDAFEGMPVGTWAFRAVATNAGATTEVAVTVVVKDDERPRILPAPQLPPLLLDATSPRGARFTLPPLRATDNCPGARLTTDPPSGSTVPSGTTRVAVTATDTSGNRAVSTVRVVVRGLIVQLAELRPLLAAIPSAGTDLARRAGAIRRLVSGPSTAACEALADLTVRVGKLEPGALGAADRATLTRRLKGLKRVLSC